MSYYLHYTFHYRFLFFCDTIKIIYNNNNNNNPPLN